MLAAIVPAHNEALHLGDCVASLLRAARCPELHGEPVVVIVVLDSCTDASESVARDAGATTIAVNACNVGAARAAGARRAIQLGARWLGFTDADSTVAPEWLSRQLALGSDAVCGTVAVSDWGSYGERMHAHYRDTYTDADGHRHIHGANLGVSTAAYLSVGGFRPLESSEDVDLVEMLQLHGALIAWSAAPRVVTSARRDFRAPHGFGATLLRVEADAARASAGS